MWGQNLSTLKNYTLQNALIFFSVKTATTRQVSVGYKYFAEGYVQGVQINGLEVKAHCYRSQRKNEKPHQLYLKFDENDEHLNMVEAHCTCEAGQSESCNHLVGFAYQLQDYVLKGLTSVPDEISCTSEPMKWNKPRTKKIQPAVLGDVTFYKPLKTTHKRAPVEEKFFEPIKPEGLKSVAPTDVETLISVLKEINPEIPMACFLSVPAPNGENSVPGKKGLLVPENSLLAHQFVKEGQVERLSPPIALPQLEGATAEKISQIFQSKPKIGSCRFDGFTLSDAHELEKTTRQQSNSQLWHEARRLRITASQFGSVCKRQKYNDKFEELLKNRKNISHLPCVATGIEEEANARDLYLVQCPDVSYFPCGLLVHPLAPFLGASPDGIIFDDSMEEFGVLEIKCKSGAKYGSLAEALRIKNFCLRKDENDEIILKKDNPYYYQIQGQMFISGLSWGDFVVYFVNSKEVVLTRINFDEEFCKNMYHQLYYIYNMYFTE